MTAPPIETELKLATSEAGLAVLLRLPWLRALRDGPVRTRRLTSTYYDTPEGILWTRGVTLRLRHDGASWVQTVKAAPQEAAGLFKRLEWERSVPDGRLDLERPRAAGLRKALAGVETADAVRPCFTTDIRRTEVRLRDGGCTVLMALDRGAVRANGHSAPVCEAELELVEGTAGDLYRLAERIAAAVPVRLELRAKAERGHALAVSAAVPGPQKAQALDLDPDMTAGAAFQAIAGGCLAQMAANVRPLVEARDGEAIHQMRVATRRLRSAMTTFKAVAAGPGLTAVKDDLRWLMGSLGPARDADVFLSEILGPVRTVFPDDPGLASLHALFSDRRERRFDAAVAAVSDPRFTRLLLGLGAWIEAGDWRASGDDGPREMPLDRFARKTLEARWRKVAKPARTFDRLSDTKRHKMRIQVKKLRYTTEFFGSLFRKKTVKPFVKGLSTLQDQLGALNDVAVARETLHETLHETVADQRAGDDGVAAAERAWAAGLVAGWHRRDAGDRLAEAGRTLKAVRQAAGFWR
ncbi:CYTH and CHAD domain-containing protein [Roseospira goensis]|uniref:Inorganic triphosphatase YgiF n=1 Tax=Roseospira goensis TaxID=391922 RepID=A0A7W6RXF9_9PROT|nr:CYTH and CHAD domain-containing protein [Roseospira goensis]MBB4285003.1 inorganic triphosphatase YgiF [Roseospira goensis]